MHALADMKLAIINSPNAFYDGAQFNCYQPHIISKQGPNV